MVVKLATTARVLGTVIAEMRATGHRVCPVDPLRRVCLVAEEVGEAVKAALDLTRRSTQPCEIAELRAQLRRELIHTASMTMVVLVAMTEEDEQQDLPTE